MMLSIERIIPIFSVRTMEDLFDQRSVKIAHIFTGFVALLGAMGLVLALVGLYAVVSYQVARKTRGIGIRVALGAAERLVLTMVLMICAAIAVAWVCNEPVLE